MIWVQFWFNQRHFNFREFGVYVQVTPSRSFHHEFYTKMWVFWKLWHFLKTFFWNFWHTLGHSRKPAAFDSGHVRNLDISIFTTFRRIQRAYQQWCNYPITCISCDKPHPWTKYGAGHENNSFRSLYFR